MHHPIAQGNVTTTSGLNINQQLRIVISFASEYLHCLFKILHEPFSG